MCSIDNFTNDPTKCRMKKLGYEVIENCHNIEDMGNELVCDSNDQLYLFSVFTFRSFQLTCK